jgi:Rod binding domain-containing protein
MEPSRRFHLLLPAALHAELTTFARDRGLGLAAALRQLAMTALQDDAQGTEPEPESAATLATLCAAEHAVLMVASVLPEGQRRMRELAPEAAQAAEVRLAHFRGSGL